MVTKLSDLISRMAAQFRDAGIDTPLLDARLLIQAVMGITREQLLMSNQLDISDSQSKTLEEFVHRRVKREPVSRITGMRGFWKYEFKVSKETLDPRPDSEALVEAALKIAPRDKPLRILDLGTGTGCLLLSLLAELPKATGIGIDISADAVATARQNAEMLHVSKRAEIIQADWETMDVKGPFDIILSNPPYIPEADIADLDPEVRNYDPHRALSGGADGLVCYNKIAGLLPDLIDKKGYIYLEIGHDQAEEVKTILGNAGFDVLRILPDLAGHDRCVVAQRADSK